MEQLNEQLDQTKRAKSSLEKAKQALESQTKELESEVKQLSSGKQVSAVDAKQVEVSVCLSCDVTSDCLCLSGKRTEAEAVGGELVGGDHPFARDRAYQG